MLKNQPENSLSLSFNAIFVLNARVLESIDKHLKKNSAKVLFFFFNDINYSNYVINE